MESNFEHNRNLEEWEFWGADEPTRPLRRTTRPATAVAVTPAAVPLRQRLSAIDPAFRRVAAILAVVAVMIGAVVALVGGSPDGPATLTPLAPAQAGAAKVPAKRPTTVAPAATPAPARRAAASTAAAAASDRPVAAAAQPQALTSRATVRSCRARYTIRAGDYWLSIARRARVTLNQMLAANRATARTSLYPGMRVCLPANATLPLRPAAAVAKRVTKVTKPVTKPVTKTTKPVTKVTKPVTKTTKPVTKTTKPKVTKPVTRVTKPVTRTTRPRVTPTTRPRPRPTATTKPKPPTTVPRQKTYTRDEVIQIIREVWPDDQEEKAIAIAWRESNWTPRVRNYCCYGLFQIYWSVHSSWLKPLGVGSAEMLYDPRINATAALALYQRSGNSWAPWNL